jgi:hypothetical protein
MRDHGTVMPQGNPVAVFPRTPSAHILERYCDV